jgi:hypothetical protein
MLETHNTIKGTILIAQLEDDELLNIIGAICRRIKVAIEIIEGMPIEGGKIIEALRPEYGERNIQERAKETLRTADKLISPYICEAALRGLGIAEILQEAYQRKAAIPNGRKLALGLYNESAKNLQTLQTLQEHPNPNDWGDGY